MDIAHLRKVSSSVGGSYGVIRRHLSLSTMPLKSLAEGRTSDVEYPRCGPAWWCDQLRGGLCDIGEVHGRVQNWVRLVGGVVLRRHWL